MSDFAGCPSINELARIRQDPSLPGSEREKLQKHMAGCKNCQKNLRDMLAKQVRQENEGPPPAKLNPTSQSQPTNSGSQNDTPAPQSETIRIDPSPVDPNNPHPFMDPPEAEGEIGWISNYRVFRVVGSGGMGVVFEAEDKDLRRRVALKVLRSDLGDDSYRQRFLQEARLAAQLQSEYIVTIFRVGEWTGPDAQTVPFLAMEFLHGESLEARLLRDSFLSTREALRYIRQVAEGLGDAHQKNLIHRDIKPANIWLESNPETGEFRRVKILDFGLAKPVNEESSLTHHGMVVGTPSYMAPEQIYGLPCDQRTDLYGLGCLLFKCLCGKTPFQGENTMAVLRATVEAESPDLAGIGKTLPRDIIKLLEDLLAKDPDKRLPNAREVIKRVNQILGDEPARSNGSPKPREMGTRETSFEPNRRSVLAQKQTIAVISSIAVLVLAAAYPVITLIFRYTNPVVAPPLEEVNIGLLFSKTGPSSSRDKPLIDICKAAFNDLLPDSTLLGNRIVIVEKDAQSNPEEYAKATARLMEQDKAVAIFGCTSPSFRRRTSEILKNYHGLLFCPTPSEGMDDTPGVIHMGPIPNQIVDTLLEYSIKFPAKTGNERKLFLVGMDEIGSRASSHFTRMVVEKNYANTHALVGTEFIPSVEPYKYIEKVVDSIVAASPDIVITTIANHEALTKLVSEIRKRGITSEKMPGFHILLDEVLLSKIHAENNGILEGDFAVANYFTSLRSRANDEFLKSVADDLGKGFPVTDAMVKAHTSIRLWIQAVKKAESFDSDLVLHALHESNWESPAGIAKVLDNNHSQFRVRVAKVRNNGLTIVEESRAVPPDIFPHFVPADGRTREQQITAKDRWLTMTRLMQTGYQENNNYSEWENLTNPLPLKIIPKPWWNQLK
jgi:urea transport system substrate-binding protein